MTPVMFTDSTGYFAVSILVIGLVAGAIIGGTVGGVAAYNIAKDNNAEGWELAGWTLAGVAGGAAIGAALGYAGASLYSSATGIVGLSITKYSIVPIKGVTLLGSYPLYKDSAILTNSGFYDIGKTWNNLTTAQRTLNNSTYLADANKLGSQFAIFTGRVTTTATSLWEEIHYLIENGIPFEMF